MKTILLDAINLLTRSQRKKGFTVFLLLVAGSLFELVSFAAFIPIIMLLLNPGDHRNRFQINIEQFTGNYSNGYFIIGLTIFATLLILLKTIIIGRIIKAKAE